ncbi:uncharacterized protein PAC_19899 [Phialocephala subalpina]|uniref:Uncharacterized protein n=1 Tax=Phialocephala subalpina TaxID=576137 RepID=A0A1L7XY99_9HELO|nr:uncharacterized protein PAC_19899 [Phialocephala subalpina]
MLLRSLPTQEAENESQALPRKAARGILADYPEALRVCQLKNLRDFALLPTSREASGTPGVEIRPYSSVFQVWINNMHLNPDMKGFSDQFTYAAWFGDLLLQAGADILSKSAGSKYLIEEATLRMNFNDDKYVPIVTWLIREHTRGAKPDPLRNSEINQSRLGHLDVTASKTHRMALDLGWKCALWNRTSLAMELYFDSGIMFDVTPLSLKSMKPKIATQYAKILGDVPGVNLFRDATAHEGTRSSPLSLLTLSVMRNRQNTTNLDELRRVWEACIVFDCRINEIFVHPQNIQFIEKMAAHTRTQMHLESRLEIFMATLPEGGAVGSPLECRCMAGLISELDGIFGSQLENSTTTSTWVVGEIDRLLGKFRKELATLPRDSDAEFEGESLVQKFSRGALRFVDERRISPSVDVSFRWSTAISWWSRGTLRYLNIARVLLQGGASLAALDTEGRSVLHEAVECGSSKAIGFLLHMGLNPGHQNVAGQTSFHLAVERGDVFALNMLCEKISAIDYSSFDKYPISAITLPKHNSGSLSKPGLFSSFTSFRDRSHNNFLRELARKKDCIGTTAFGLALRAGSKGNPVLDFILNEAPVLSQDHF